MNAKLNIRCTRRRGMATALAVVCSLPFAVVAQERAGYLEEVVVTAQKREQSLQEVPLAISAITAEELEVRQVVNLQDIQNFVPNLYLQEALSGPSTVKAFIRGVGVDNQVFSFDSPIGIYVDGVYYARVTGTLVDVFDAERVEVLRGPQGTLYGRNNSVGAIRIVSNPAPLDEIVAKGEVTFGRRNQINSRLVLGLPLIRNTLGMRVAVNTRNNNGWMRDLNTGQKRKDDDLDAVRAQLRYVPNEDVEITVRGDYLTDESKGSAASNFLINPDGDINTFESTFAARNRVDSWGASATLKWTLPAFEVTSISAYRNLQYRNAEDFDGRADVRSFEVERQELSEWQVTEEFYLSGDDLWWLPLKWVAGMFYFHEENDFDWALRVFAPPSLNIFDQETDSISAYTQGTYAVTDRLRITGGLRWTHDEKDFSWFQVLPSGAINPDDFQGVKEANKVNYHTAVDFDLIDGVLLYFNAGTGFRSGGFNGSGTNKGGVVGGQFGEEESFSLEWGVKSDLFDRRLRLNLSYFYVDYDGLQFAITDSAGNISSVGVAATVHGIEGEVRAAPLKDLELFATFGSMFDDIENSDLELKDTPEWQFTVGGQYTWPVRVPYLGGRMRLAADVHYRTDAFNDTNNRPFTNTGDYEMVNASLTYETEDGHWALTLAGRNLTDQFVNIHTFNIGNGFIASVHNVNTPRRWLVTLRYSY